jgi:23S rRNA A1618 N6-methylase RlmF
MKGGICISISIKLREQMVASSSITRMFEEKVGEKEFYDFTLGNPEIEKSLDGFRTVRNFFNKTSKRRE